MAVTDDLTLWSLNTLDDTGAIVPRQMPIPIAVMERLFTNGGAESLASPSTFLEWAKARTRVPPWFDITEPLGRMLVGADRLASLLARYEGVVSAPDRAAVAAYQTGPQPVDEAVRAAGDAWESYFFAGGARPTVKADLDVVVPPREGPLLAGLAPKERPTFFGPLPKQTGLPNWATPQALSQWRQRFGERALAEMQALDRFLDETSTKYGVRPDLMRRLIREESGGDPDVPGDAGEIGLMQLMPDTAKQLGVKDRHDPRANVEGGIRFFSDLLREFGNETHALAGYNAGAPAVRGALRRGALSPRMLAYVDKFRDMLTAPAGTGARVAGPVAERLRDPSLGSALALAAPPLPPQPEDTGGLPPSTSVASPYPPLPVDRDYGVLRQFTHRAIRELFPTIPPTKWFREIWGDEVRREQLDARVRELYWPDRLPAPTQVAEERPPLPPIAARPGLLPEFLRRPELPPRPGISGPALLADLEEPRTPLERVVAEVPPPAVPGLPSRPLAAPPVPATPTRLPSIAMRGRPIAPDAAMALVPPQTRSMIPSAAEVRAHPNVPAITPRPTELGQPSGVPVPRGTIATAPAPPVRPPPSVAAPAQPSPRPTVGRIVEAVTPSVAAAAELPLPAVTDEDLALAHQALVRELGQAPAAEEVTDEDLALAHLALVAAEPRARAVFPETAPFPMPQPTRPPPQAVLTPAEAAPIERGEPIPTVQERIETTLAPFRQAWEPLRTERSAIEEEGAGLEREAERLEQLRGAVAAGKSAERFNAQVDAYNRRLTDHQAHAAAWQAAVEQFLASVPPDVAPLLDIPAQPLTPPPAPSAQLVEEQLRAPLVPPAEEAPAQADLESVVGYGGRTVTPAERTANKLRRAIVFGVRTGAIGATARWLSNVVDDALGRPARTAGPVEPIGDTTWERAVALLASLGTDVPVFRLGALLVAAPARALLGSMRGTIEAELIAAGGEMLPGQAKAMAAKVVGNSFAAKEIIRESIPVWVRQGISAGLTPVQAARAARAAADAVLMTTLDPVAVSVGRATLMAGAVGLEDTSREAAHQLAEHGRIVDPTRIATEGATGLALGAGAGAISGIVSSETLKVLSETAWWGAAQPVLKEGRVPTVEDFVAAGIPISVLHFATREARARVTGPQVRRIPEARRVDTEGPARPEPPVEAPTPPPVVPRPADVGRRPRPRPVRPAPPALAPAPPAPAPPAEAPPGPGVAAPAPPAAPVRPVEAPPAPGEALPPAGPPIAPPEPVPAPPGPPEVQPFAAVLYQGRGKTAEEIYGKENVAAGRGHPLVGPGEYYALSKKDAARYGAVTTQRVELRRPYVLTSDRQWFDLLRVAGATQLSSVDREQGPTLDASQRLRDYLVRQGYDGLIARFPSAVEGDVGETGQNIKRLRESFGHSTVVKFPVGKAEAPAVPQPTAPTGPAPEPPVAPTAPEPPAAPAEAPRVQPTQPPAGAPLAAPEAALAPVEARKTEGRYAVEVTTGGGKWSRNALRFDTPAEAESYASDLASRWIDVQDWRVIDTQTEIPAGPLPTTPVEAPAVTPGLPVAYEHADRLRRMTALFERQIREQNQLPTDPRALRAMVAQELGIQPSAFTADARLMDDLQDAIETAINKVYRERRPEADLRQHIERAEATERWLGSRIRTLELTARQQFSTPLTLAEAGSYALDLRRGDTVLEPTAGTGNLLAALPQGTPVVLNELDLRRAEALRIQGHEPLTGDYLRATTTTGTADLVLMNPPWGKHSTRRYGQPIPMPYGQPIDVAERFFMKALADVRPGGRVVAVMPTTILKAPKFLEWLRTEHTLRALVQAPPHAYDTRGTTVGSVLLVVDKGRIQGAPESIRGAASDFAALGDLLRPLAAGGTHARVPGGVGPPSALPEPPGEPTGRPSGGPTEPAPRPGVSPAVPRPAEPSPPSPPAAGGPGRPPEAGVPGVGGGPPPRAGEPRPPVVPVGVGGGGVEPGGPPQPVSERSDSPPRAAEPTFVEGVGAERYSVADPAELDAARRSLVFVPAPLRRAPGLNPHPRLVVRTRSLAGAKLPALTYEPRGQMIADAYRRKVISDSQLDYGVLPALQADANHHGFLMAADVGVGKALPLDVRVLTPSGWRQLGTLVVGDLVIGADGTSTPILGVYPQGDRQMFCVTLSDGVSIECDDEHLWLTQTTYERNNERRRPKGCPGRVRPLAEIRATLSAPTRREKNHTIPIVAPVQFDKQSVPLDPYLIGVLLGDGGLSRPSAVTLTSTDDELLDAVREVLPEGIMLRRHGVDRITYGLTQGRSGGRPNPVLNAVRALGVHRILAHEKHVPEAYLINDVPCRLRVLRGLMDTDGYVDHRGTSPIFTTTSRRLADDVVFLVQSLGGVATLHTKRPHYRYRGEVREGRVAYNVVVSLPSSTNPFALHRKAALVRPKSKYPPRRYIVDVVPARVTGAQCIKVAAPDGLFVVDGFVVTHNTRVAAAVIGEWLETGKYKRILYVTNSEVNVQDAIGEFNIYAGKPYPFEIIPVRSFPGAKERQGKAPEDREALPARPQAIYIIDHYNLASFEAALKELDLDAVVGDEAHLLRNIDDAKVGQSWNRIQLGVLAKRGGFLYLTATPATDFDDLKQFIGLREWVPGGFEDYVARVTGASPEAQGDIGALRARLDSLIAQWQRLRDVPEDEKTRLLDALPDTDSWGADLVERLRDAIDRVENALVDKAQAPATMVGGDADDIRHTRPGKRRFGGRDVFSAHVTPAEQEQVMRELAMKNKYDSIDLWRAGVEFEIVTNPLTVDQTSEYARLSAFMRDLNRDFLTWGRLNKTTGRLLTIRHFLQQEAKRRMFDYRLDHAIRLAKESLDGGEQPVISLINVNEGTEQSGPIPAAINSINVRHVESDPHTGEITIDEVIPEAVQRRAELLDRWAEFRQVPNPVDRILAAFGRENVAAIIGKTSPAMREKVIREFQQGERRVAVISGAGKIGISLHHVIDIPGAAKGRRHMIVADYEWSAEKFKQELGRVDRSGQRSPPRITPLSTGQAGEKKFLATIANRMRNLGALSKGSAESASNDKLAEFELGGGLDTHAMRLAYRALDPDIQQKFLASSFRDPQNREQNTSAYPQNASLKDFLLDIQFMEPEDGNAAFERFWAERERLIAEHEETEERRAGRTRAYRGDIVRSVTLRPDLTLHEVRDEHGQHYGLLQGIITPHLSRIARFLEQSERSGLPIRKYVTFQSGDRQLAGLEIRAGSMAPLMESFGKSAARQLDTPEQVLEALRAGDKVPLEGAAGYVLRMRPSDKRLQIQGAKMVDKDSLLRAGATYAPVGNFWFVPEDKIAQFLERYPVKPPPAPEVSFMAVPTVPELPPVPTGHIRLFRGEAIPTGARLPEWIEVGRQISGVTEATGRWFHADMSEATWYAADAEHGRIGYVDVPVQEAEQYRVSALPEGHPAHRFSRRPDEEFFLPREVAGRVSFMAAQPALPSVETVRAGLQKAASIEGAPGLRLADTTDFYFTPERLRALAQGPHLAPLASAAANAYQRLRDRLALDNALYADSYFFGLSLDPGYYGLNFGSLGPSAVLLNAHANAAVIDNYVGNGLIRPEDAPVEMARRLVDVLLHEATHEAVRRHAKPDDLFAVAYVRNAENTAELRAELVADLAQVLREGNVYAAFRDEARQLAAERAGARRAEPARPDLAIHAGAPRGAGGPPARAAPGARPGEALPAGGPGAVAGMATGAELGGREPERVRVVETPPRDLEREGWRRTAGIGVIPLDRVQDLVEPRRSVGMEHVVQRLSPRLGVVWEREVEAPVAPTAAPEVGLPPVAPTGAGAPPEEPPRPPSPPVAEPPEEPEGGADPAAEDPGEAPSERPRLHTEGEREEFFRAEAERIAEEIRARGDEPEIEATGEGRFWVRWRTGALDSLRRLVAPAARGPVAQQMAGIIRKNDAELIRETEMGRWRFRHAAHEMDRLPEAQRFAFIDFIERGEISNLPAQYRQVGQALREALDDRRATVQALGTGALERFIEDYFPHIWRGREGFMEALRRAFGKRPLEGSKAFLRHRTIPTTRDGLRAGLQPVSSNPVTLTLLKLREMDKYVMGQKVFQEMKAKGLARFVRERDIAEARRTGMAEINDRIAHVRQFVPEERGFIERGQWMAPEEAARLLNNYLAPGLRGNAMFDAYRGFGNLMNQFQLGFSFFHLGFVALDTQISAVSLGLQEAALGLRDLDPSLIVKGTARALFSPTAPFTAIVRGHRLLREYYEPGSQGELLGRVIDALVKAGGRARMDRWYSAEALERFAEAARARDSLGMARWGLPAFIEAVAWPTMEFSVPRMKLAVFADLARFEMERMPAWATEEDVVATLGKVWDSVENRLGQLTYNNLFWHPKFKDVLMGTIRAVGWNLGTKREILSAALTDLPKMLGHEAARIHGRLSGDSEATQAGRDRDRYRDLHTASPLPRRLAYLLALPVVNAIWSAIYQYLHTGEWPDQPFDFVMPRTGRTRKDGSPDRVSLPTYMKDVVAYASDLALGHPLRTLLHKIHPELRMIVDLFNNRDYREGAIRNPDDPLVRQLADSVDYVIEQFQPFSVTGFQREIELGRPGSEAVETFFGIVPAPAYAVRPYEQSRAIQRKFEAQPMGRKRRREEREGLGPSRTILKELGQP